MILAGAALAATAALSWISYRSVRDAMTEEFARRLELMAATAASQVSAADVEEARRLGDEGPGYLAIQLLLETLRSNAGILDASLLDTTRTVIFDGRGPERERQPSPLSALAPEGIAHAFGGRAAVSPPFRLAGQVERAGFAPVRDAAGGVVGVVAVEASPTYLAELEHLGSRLLLTTLVIGLAIVVLGAVIFRVTQSAVRLERRLSRAENLAAMGRLTATLAHEIKNPLAIIRGSAERLGKLEPEARRMAEYVVEETDRLSRTVARYLQFARGEHAGTQPGDAVKALEATLDLLEGEIKARRVTLERAGATVASAPVRLDDESLKQVYLNLVLNALEAMPQGGTLGVTLAEPRGRVEVRIADTGVGIAPETLRALSQPFVTTKAQGSGLGLFLTRRLLESAGGTLEIASQEGAGTTVVVRLPRR